MPKLIVYHEGTQEEHELASEPVILGRSSSSGIPVPDVRASREHCKIAQEDGKWYVIDLGSSNGTFVGDRKITRHELTDGTFIRIGRVRIGFVDEGRRVDAPAAQPVEKPETGAVEAHLQASAGPCDGRTFRIEKSVTRIGRGPNSDIVLEDSAVSNRHAELLFDGQSARIVDKRSRNGVKVNHALISNHALESGDEIHIGKSTLRFILGPVEEGVSAAASEQPAEPDAAGPGEPDTAPAGSGRRGKMVAGVITAVVLACLIWQGTALLRKPADRSGRRDGARGKNLLTGKHNPSFEDRSAAGIPGWHAALGEARLEQEGAEDGAWALRLVSSSGTGRGLSAACWSSEVPVSPRTVYRLSALVRSFDSGSAVLCAQWLDRERPWLRGMQLGHWTADAPEWRRVEDVFEPPSWATDARFACGLIGEGGASFDGLELTRAGEAAEPRRISAGRLALEPGPDGRFVLFADGEPMLATDGGMSFRRADNNDGETLQLDYRGTPADSEGAVPGIKLISSRALLDHSAILQTADGKSREMADPFETIAGVGLITFFADHQDRRVFLRPVRPASVKAVDREGGSIAWRITFPTGDADRGAVGLAWMATDREKNERVAAAMKSAADAEEQKRYGAAARLYRAFIRSHRFYGTERAAAAERLRAVQAKIAGELATLERQIAAAVASGRDEDFAEAEGACQALQERIRSDASREPLKDKLDGLRAKQNAAREAQARKKAVDAIQRAKDHMARGEPHPARWILTDVAQRYKRTPFAQEARQLLEKLPRPK